jgi:hypothetical protein
MPIYIANRENQRNKIYKLLFIYLRGKKYSKMKKRVIEQMSIVKKKENCSILQCQNVSFFYLIHNLFFLTFFPLNQFRIIGFQEYIKSLKEY